MDFVGTEAFSHCNKLTIYTDASSFSDFPSDWGQYWEYTDIAAGIKVNIIYNISKEDYDNEF
jgi:hypothetical protein